MAEIGKGVVSIDSALQKACNEANVNKLIAQQQVNNEEIGNWEKTQKSLPFMERFNSYYKDKYLKTSAMVLAKEYVNNLYSDSEYYKKDNNVIQKMMQDNTAKLLDSYKSLGMQVKFYK